MDTEYLNKNTSTEVPMEVIIIFLAFYYSKDTCSTGYPMERLPSDLRKPEAN